MAIFGGLAKGMKDMPYDNIKKMFADKFSKKFPNVDFDKEWVKIGGTLPKKSVTK